MSIWVVSKEEAGSRLVNFIRDKADGTYPARQIKRALERNLCQVNGSVERFASRTLEAGDRITFEIEKIASDEPVKVFKKLYADEHLLVCEKPAGVVVDRAETVNALQKQFGSVLLVHRLDRETTGALLLARTPEVAAALEDQFRKHEIDKRYLAVVDGCPQANQGEILNQLGKRHSYEGQAIWGEVPAGRGRLAHTLWKVAGRGKLASLLLLQPRTGRTHQLRAHLKEMGHPILGDYQYARQFACPYRPERCLLHASEITFTHPCSGVRQQVRAALPEDFATALKELQIRF